ncbi:MAG: YvcK family protein [Clostridia bacterium]
MKINKKILILFIIQIILLIFSVLLKNIYLSVILSICIIISTYLIYKYTINIFTKHLSKEQKDLEIKRLKTENSKGPHIVIIGGGSGLSNILKGLKEYTPNITAIVTTFDDGGSTGKLKKEMDVLAPGDIRKCITALSNKESAMDKLLAYRFKDGNIDNHSLGNLFLVAMTDIMGSFPLAIQKISEIFSVTGKVLPITLDKITLCCKFKDGTIAIGEENISKEGINKKIKNIYLKEEFANPAPDVIESIKNADIIILRSW